MPDESITQCWLFPPLFDKPVGACFDQPYVSSDGWLILTKGFDQRMELTESLAPCLHEGWQPGKIHPSLLERMRQRICCLTCGYADGNEAARVAPIRFISCWPSETLSGEDLASQPILSRFENAVGPKALYCLGKALVKTVIGGPEFISIQVCPDHLTHTCYFRRQRCY